MFLEARPTPTYLSSNPGLHEQLQRTYELSHLLRRQLAVKSAPIIPNSELVRAPIGKHPRPKMSRLFLAPSALRTVVRGATRHQQPSFTRSAPLPFFLPNPNPRAQPLAALLNRPPLSLSFAHRAMSSLPLLRPRTTAVAPSFAARRPTTSSLLLLLVGPCPPPTTTTTTAVDLIPTSAISAHPALRHAQIRCGPRRYMNMNRPSRLIRNRRTGFLTRMKTKDGRNTIARRRAKGRKRLGAA